jgi:hypothetical protein
VYSVHGQEDLPGNSVSSRETLSNFALHRIAARLRF